MYILLASIVLTISGCKNKKQKTVTCDVVTASVQYIDSSTSMLDSVDFDNEFKSKVYSVYKEDIKNIIENGEDIDEHAKITAELLALSDFYKLNYHNKISENLEKFYDDETHLYNEHYYEDNKDLDREIANTIEVYSVLSRYEIVFPHKETEQALINYFNTILDKDDITDDQFRNAIGCYLAVENMGRLNEIKTDKFYEIMDDSRNSVMDNFEETLNVPNITNVSLYASYGSIPYKRDGNDEYIKKASELYSEIKSSNQIEASEDGELDYIITCDNIAYISEYISISENQCVVDELKKITIKNYNNTIGEKMGNKIR